ncbi:MAG: hypothetical protein ACOCRN_02750 [Spirochaetia bacterium]
MAQQNTEDVRKQVEKLLTDEPAITDATRIVTRVEKVGPLFKKRMTVTLEGKVPNEAEKRKVEQVLNSHYKDDIAIKNNLEIA